MADRKDKNLLERCLTPFTEVRAGEGLTAVLLTLNVFLVLGSYYIAKVVREPLILVGGGGAEVKSYSSAGQVILLLGAVRLYAWLASKMDRKKLINIVNIFFSACLAAFFVLARLEVPVGIVFFLWVGMFNVMVVAQFWSFANDVYTPEEGKRLFALVAFGIPIFGVYQLLLVAGGVLLLSLVITNYVEARERRRRETHPDPGDVKPEESFSTEGAFKLVFDNKYLFMIAFLILLLNWVNTTGEYILGRIVEQTAEEMSGNEKAQEAFIGQFYADFFTSSLSSIFPVC